MRCSLRSGVIAAGLVSVALSFAATANAQQGAPVVTPTASSDAALASQRCTGVLCDAYYSMHPNARPGETSLPCHDFVCGMFGGQTQTPMPQAQPVAQQAMPEPTPHKMRRKKHRTVALRTAAPTEVAPVAEPAAR